MVAAECKGLEDCGRSLQLENTETRWFRFIAAERFNDSLVLNEAAANK